MIKKIGLFALSTFLVVSPLIASAEALNRQLQVGMSGSDVSTLQTFLASDTALYPQGTVSGYFGFLTKAAVSNFQSRNGIDPVGRVGPATLPVLNLQIAQGMNGGADVYSAIITSVSVSAGRAAATVAWNTSENARGVVYYSTSPLAMSESLHSVSISGASVMTDNGFRTSQNVSIQNLSANTTYYYMVYTTDQAGNVSVTWPSTFQTTN